MLTNETYGFGFRLLLRVHAMAGAESPMVDGRFCFARSSIGDRGPCSDDVLYSIDGRFPSVVHQEGETLIPSWERCQ